MYHGMGTPMQETSIYSLNFADDQAVIPQDHYDEYMKTWMNMRNRNLIYMWKSKIFMYW
jgi:hypothetical protein